VIEANTSTAFYVSPYAGTSYYGTTAGDFDAVFIGVITNPPDFSFGSATFNAPTGTNDLSLFWGSPDSYNTIKFYSGLNGTGSLLATLTGTTILNDGSGNDLANILLGAAFDSVVLSTTQDSFEFSDLTFSTATPLPSTWTMLLAGIVGLAFFAHYRGKQRRVAAA
jgi:hypothetical protein